jgi:hypothetical protein
MILTAVAHPPWPEFHQILVGSSIKMLNADQLSVLKVVAHVKLVDERVVSVCTSYDTIRYNILFYIIDL